MIPHRIILAVINCVLALQICFFVSDLPCNGPRQPLTYWQEDDVKKNIDDANFQIEGIRKVILGVKDPTPRLQWNRYVTNNFELLSLDDAQGKYLSDNIEFIKIWCLWRWGTKDFDFPAIKNTKGETVKVKCKVICLPSADLYEKLFGRKTPSCRMEVNKEGVPEYTIWFIAEGQKWNARLPNLLTEVCITNFEANTGSRLPIWSRRGMSVLNGRIEDIKTILPQAGSFNSKTLLTMTQESYGKMSDAEKVSFDAQAAAFCLWVRQGFNGKVFLDYLGGSMINPEYCLQYLGVTRFADCDAKVKVYLANLAGGHDHLFTW